MGLNLAVGHTDTAHPRRTFLHHYLEMLVVMVVGMMLLGGVVTGIFAILGHSNLLHHAGLRAFVMSTDMTIAMIVWMRFRGHGWPATLEMGASMILPYFLLVGPYAARWIGGGAFLGLMHALMLPFMFLVMLRRYDEYSTDHRAHAEAH